MEQLDIDRLGAQGDGIAQSDAGDIFVPFSLPGERVEGVVTDGRMADPKVISASPDRVAPPCPHFGRCGGCALQHASDGFLGAYKCAQVERALAARGIDTPVRLIATSAPGSRRRATFSGRRTRKTVQVGFHERGTDTLLEIADCLLVTPAILAARPALEDLTRRGASRKGQVRLSVTDSRAGLDIAVEEATALDRGLERDLADLAATHDLARLTWNGEGIATRRPPVHVFGRAQVVPPPGAFLQATADGEAALVAAVRAGLKGAKRVADLFCGAGTFTFPLAETAQVLALEGDAAMVAALDRAWRESSGLKPVVARRRDLFRRPLLGAEMKGLDAILLDPPRAGAAAQVAEIATGPVDRVVYVSCNPITFARDAQVLAGAGFRIGAVGVVDQFRWSGHVELVAGFTRG
ncbi:class I SAM-dependent RNA methyltransferase [Oceanomicrobium pacificus]|uniref:Class I SAM-dependent RNA methyltransferase n=1 Tax=Oceanomicrobium pacificus TaxID=2692916 RepID=A0A6B0U1G1_9RHOB|nr:class I SAM-dependent RNA methyltransferase [Oceanomicrobium pacificus]MXU64941.1 class I SAM-dependent RNA methyltransferase [Oceanomicrobium pacificus]